jgi:hypothetical protein
MNERRWERLGAEAGIAFVVLGVAALFAPGTAPAQDASGRTLITYIADHRNGLRASMVLWSLATVCGLFFVATLRARLSEAEGGHNELATAAVAGGLFAFAMNWVGGLMIAPAIMRDGTGLAPETVRAMVDGSNLAGLAANVGGAVLAGAVAAVVLSTGLLPRWVGWLSAVVAVNCVVSLFGFLAASGPFAVGGAYQVVTLMSALVLILAIAVEFMVHAEAPAPAGSGSRSAAAMSA